MNHSTSNTTLTDPTHIDQRLDYEEH